MKSFRLENRSRDKIRLQAQRPGPNKGEVERDPENDIVLGDMLDTDDFLESKGATRNPRCPSPVVTITEQQLQRLAPASRSALDAWRSGPKPKIVMTELPG